MNIILVLLLSIFALSAANTVKTIPADKITVDLDQPPSQRWSAAINHYGGRNAGEAIMAYFNNLDKLVPKPALELLEFLAADIDKYGKGIPEDLREEMKALASGLDIELGIVVALNFLYELRWLAPNANTTGPCDDCVHPGACTSIVASDGTAALHARNLDWNLPNSVRGLTFQCQFARSGRPLYQGACFLGFVGMASAFKGHAFAVTIDERGDGGNLMVDAIMAVIEGASDPTHALRAVFETATDFAGAKKALSEVELSAPVYYIVSGPSATDGDVITRERTSVKSDRALDAKSWFVLETNYDWDEQPPSYDDRRKYALKYMNDLGPDHVTLANLKTVISTWPVLNNHTSYTTLMDVSADSFEVLIRLLED